MTRMGLLTGLDRFFRNLSEAGVFRFQVFVFVFLVLAAWAAYLFWANPRVEFVVTNPSGAPVSEALVRVFTPGGVLVAEGRTVNGVVVFRTLQFAPYRFTITASGFDSFSGDFAAQRQHVIKTQLASSYGPYG